MFYYESPETFARKDTKMSLLKLAVTTQRWDLAAHIIVLAGAKAVLGEKKNAGKPRSGTNRKSKQNH